MTPDILGDGWTCRTLQLAPDAEGEVVASLVHRDRPPRDGPAVLYVHGFIDYFFQTHLAEALEAAGCDFYALDLRKYGRSMRPHQTPNHADDLAVYDAELDLAAEIIRAERGHSGLVLMGHSTGGLVASLHAHRRPGAYRALVLNSPWLDLNAGWLMRGPATAVIDVLGGLMPHLVLAKGLAEAYGLSIHRSGGGEWDYDLALKPLAGFPVRADWMRAIRRGHAAVAAGLAVPCPVLVCCSDASGPTTRSHDAIDRTDSVLDVEQIAARAHRIGPHVTLIRIAGGLHDLVLSKPPVREAYLAAVTRWLGVYGPE
ncbi:alpha/beta hydrolase [Phreatobacter sp.]|uniref:alpha/beta hydrolase n=1 Tax=Phreatobacter sp. TaxID=1966341 RepID=UPI003F7213F8